jgi:hypothetical protein
MEGGTHSKNLRVNLTRCTQQDLSVTVCVDLHICVLNRSAVQHDYNAVLRVNLTRISVSF